MNETAERRLPVKVWVGPDPDPEIAKGVRRGGGQLARGEPLLGHIDPQSGF